MADQGIALTGGFVNEVVRVGDTVRRTAGPWTPAVHAVLRHLEAVGFAEAPRALGIDDQGREILTYLPGEAMPWTKWPEVLRRQDGVIQLGRLLRRYHDAVRSFGLPPGAVWRNPLAGPGELIRHGDFSPFNTIWVDGRVTGVIDWDFARPGSALEDLAYLAWQLVPLQPRERARQYGIAGDVELRGRLDALCKAYGTGFGRAEVLDAAVSVIELEAGETAELAHRGLHPWTRFAGDGSVEALRHEAGWIRSTRAAWLASSRGTWDYASRRW